MVELAHDEDLVTELLEPLCRIDHAQVKDLDGVLESGGPMQDEPNEAGNAATQHRPVVYSVVYFLNWLPERSRDPHKSLRQTSLIDDGLAERV